MSMFSELAVESEVQDYCREVERLLQEETSPDAVRVLKKIGRFALTRFEWNTPEWAAKYGKMFED